LVSPSSMNTVAQGKQVIHRRCLGIAVCTLINVHHSSLTVCAHKLGIEYGARRR